METYTTPANNNAATFTPSRIRAGEPCTLVAPWGDRYAGTVTGIEHTKAGAVAAVRVALSSHEDVVVCKASRARYYEGQFRATAAEHKGYRVEFGRAVQDVDHWR